MAGTTGMHLLAKQEGFLVVYPEAGGSDHLWNDGRSTTADDADDVAFIERLIEHLVNTANVDPNRIYATGLSNGGMFTLRLACELSDRIAAFAPVIANFPAELKPRCRPARLVPILFIHGSEDRLMPRHGGEIPTSPILSGAGGLVVSADKTVRFWVERNGCAQAPEVRELPDLDPTDGTRVQSTHYANCQGRSEVISLLVKGGGHTWPGAGEAARLRVSGATSRDINASEVIWRFLRQHDLPLR